MVPKQLYGGDDIDLEIGDEIWFIPGYAENSLIAVKCKIIEIEDFARKRYSNGFLFYYIDEVCGHAIGASDACGCKEEAIEELLSRYKEAKENIYGLDNEAKTDVTLQDYRNDTKKFILSTHGEDADENSFPMYPDKQHLIDWFNVEDIINL